MQPREHLQSSMELRDKYVKCCWQLQRPCWVLQSWSSGLRLAEGQGKNGTARSLASVTSNLSRRAKINNTCTWSALTIQQLYMYAVTSDLSCDSLQHVGSVYMQWPNSLKYTPIHHLPRIHCESDDISTRSTHPSYVPTLQCQNHTNQALQQLLDVCT